MFRPEPTDIIIILFVAFLIFGGANRLPEMVRALGKSVREFRLAVAGKDSDVVSKESKTESPEPPNSAS